jgi:NADPH:quinone reductase-like Zn-dependent oxidoreductase
MKAAVCNKYGPPEVVEVQDVEKPSPTGDQVLVRVRAASLNPLDAGSIKGEPYLVRIMTGLRKPKTSRLGVDLAGEVEAIGPNVTQFKVGDAVFGLCISDPLAKGAEAWSHRLGAFAEYACVSELMLVLKPGNVTFEQAACAPIAALTALQGLRDKGHVGPGQRVLINGAAGGVGTFAVQIAKSFGAEVTGVCSSRNVDLVRSIGADHTIDYTREDFTKSVQHYDLIFDCVGNHSFAECRRVLTSTGICVMAGQMTGRGMLGILAQLMAGLLVGLFVSQKMTMFLARPKGVDLAIVRDLMKDGKITPVIDRRYGLGEVAEAIRYLEGKHARGKVVIDAL